MTEIFTLECEQRSDVGRQHVKKLRKNGMIPAVVYGHKVEPKSIMVAANPFAKVYDSAGESSLIQLAISGGAPVQTIIHDVQRDALTHAISHIDFYQVNMSEKMTAEVEVIFEGIAPAVKELGGILIKNITHIEVECLPSNLPHGITVDISALKTFTDNIRVSQLVVPEGVQILNSPDDTVVLVSAPRSEEELKALEEKVAENVTDVEVVGAAEKEAEKKAKEAEAATGPAASAEKK